jgi:hypothetical protein
MNQPTTPTPDLDELARTQREALEAALNEMVNSGFGELEPTPSKPAPTPSPVGGWW